MLNPSVTTQYVEIVNYGKGVFRVVAKTDIPEDTIVEICPVAVITKRDAILLSKAIPMLKHKILVDDTVMDKEIQLFTQLGELELEKKLDEGKISQDEYVKILRSKINMNSLLDSRSHVLILGNGLLYQISETPNLVCEYYSIDKLCVFRTVRSVTRGSELTYFKQ